MLRGCHIQADTAGSQLDNASVRVVLETSDGEAETAPSRPSSTELLERVLNARPELNLKNIVVLERTGIRSKYGGAADVYDGHLIGTSTRVAVKCLRLNMNADKQIAKVR